MGRRFSQYGSLGSGSPDMGVVCCPFWGQRRMGMLVVIAKGLFIHFLSVC